MFDKQCRKCGLIKNVNMFNADARSKDGKSNQCKNCHNEYQRNPDRKHNKKVHRDLVKNARRAYYAEYVARPHVAERVKTRNAVRYKNPLLRARILTKGAKTRALKRNQSFDINVQHIADKITNGRCEKSGIVFDLTKTDNHINAFAPSIDRIENNKGYTDDNIQIVCTMYNTGKGEASDVDFIAMCVAVADRHRSDSRVIARLAELRDGL